ncbi:MAG: hypothetical protein ABI425_01650 [Patescibacteria group bacterium]
MSVSFTFRHRRSLLALPQEMKLPTLFSLLMASISAFLSIIVYPSLQPIIPLFYTLPQLDQQLARKEFMFVLPIISISVCIVNLVFGKILSKIDFLMMQLLAWLTVFLEFLLLFALVRIILII